MWRLLALVATEDDRTQVADALNLLDVSLDFAENLADMQKLVAREQFHVLLIDDEGIANQTKDVEKLAEAEIPLILIVRGKAALARYSGVAERWTAIRKPINPNTLANTVRALTRSTHLSHSVDYLRHTQPYIYNFGNIIAESEAMQAVLELVQKVAASQSSVLIRGETGTGKELVAAALHFNSPRRRENFVAVNCAALHDNLLESELFGHEKGAFTGAYKRRIGRFEQANGGSLFLDEIGDMSLSTQAKVLRVIQLQEFERLGGAQTIRVDVRIIAATNKPLDQMIEERTFREDLYYRLNVVPIHIPPLRERPDDILPMANFFLRRYASELSRRQLQFSAQTVDLLQNYRWPGNIRELENVVERAVLICTNDTILPEDLILEHAARGVKTAAPDLEDLNLANLERKAIERALALTEGVQKEAAGLLGISARAIHYKIRKYKIDMSRFGNQR